MPLGIAAKKELLEAGLGQEEAVLEEFSAEPFKEAIIKAIPKLQDAGGKSSCAATSSLVSWGQYHSPFRSHQSY